MIRRWIGKMLWLVIRAASRCLAVFLLERMIIMLTVDNGNGKKVSLWGALGQIALAGIASYGMTKINNPDNTPWAPYRDQMVAGMASTAMTFFAQQMAAQQQTAAATTNTTAQQ